jgi:hypothetical protein
MVDLTMSERVTYQQGESYFVKHDEIHTIVFNKHLPTTLLLFQYADKTKPFSRFYGRGNLPPETDHLYKPMTAEDVRRLVETAPVLI